MSECFQCGRKGHTKSTCTVPDKDHHLEVLLLASEIISVEVIRPIISEKGTDKKKKVDGQMIPRQFSIKYTAFGIPVTLGGTDVSRLDGTRFVRSGQLGACKESRANYLKPKPNFVRLFKQTGGGNIWFNADIDTIAIPRRTRFNLNQLRQRRRPKMVFFRGFENIRRVVFEEEEDEETALRLLGDQLAIDFAESIVEIEEQLFEGPSARFNKDTAWTDAVVLGKWSWGRRLIERVQICRKSMVRFLRRELVRE
jgi:hypothetical protein